MSKVMTRGGKPLLKAGKVATTNAACCGPCGGGGGGSGACCTDGVCSIETAVDCAAGGGNYLGDGTTCGGVDCTQGACCASGSCTTGIEARCAGNYLGDGTTCEGVDCAQGACCVDGSCSIETSTDCGTAGGYYYGDGTTCDPASCEVPPCECGDFEGFTDPSTTFDTKITICHVRDQRICGIPHAGNIESTETLLRVTEHCGVCIGTRIVDTVNCDGTSSHSTTAVSSCDVVCAAQSCTPTATIISNTSQSGHCTYAFGSFSGFADITITLSNQCDPSPAPPP